MPTATADDLTTRVDGVELLAVGTWDATTGKAKVTEADLAAMVDAWSNPAHDHAPVKIGHDDDRFQDAMGRPPSRRDGQPAYGWVENLRLSDDGRILIGDLVGVPTMLADVMDTALRRRSVELVRKEKVGEQTYAAVLTGVSLLGVQAPAVKGLADLRALFAEELREPEHFAVLQGDTPSVPHMPQQTPEREPQSFSTSTSGVTVRLNKSQRAALGIPDGATAEQVRGILAKKGLQMAEGEGYEEDNEEITPPETPPADTPPAATAPPPTPAAPEKVAAAAGTPPTAEQIMLAAKQFGLTVVDQERFAQLQDDAAAGRQARDEQNNARWDSIIQDAVRKGKLATTAFAKWRAKIAESPDLVIELLAAMPEGELPTKPLGHAEAYSGGLPDEADAQARADEARRAKLAAYFNIPEPAKG